MIDVKYIYMYVVEISIYGILWIDVKRIYCIYM